MTNSQHNAATSAGTSAPADVPEVPFSSNGVRLTGWQWAAATLLIIAVLTLLPRLYQGSSPPQFAADFRLPYSLSEDYWLYEQHVARSVTGDHVLMIGDSVVWGEYVLPTETLTHFLNAQSGQERFRNGGLNGAHPLALQGLVDNYADRLTGVPVMLQCNLLWMSSPERDLQVEKEQAFNHPRLVPQFWPRIPSYRASFADRLGIAIDRQFAIRGWVQHLRIDYWEGLDLPSWSLEHPYANPFSTPRADLGVDENQPRHRPVPWHEQGIQPQDMPWLELDASLQWQAFRATVARLQQRRNRVFVLLCPLNEHLLTEASRRRYRALHQQVIDWLSEQQIAFAAPAVLSSDLYGDASHPLAAGYQQLAESLNGDAGYQRWLSESPTN